MKKPPQTMPPPSRTRANPIWSVQCASSVSSRFSRKQSRCPLRVNSHRPTADQNPPMSAIVPFCVLATILTASCPARANTIIFQCGISFAVDLKNNTVNNQPATINATAIDWQLIPGPANDTGVVSYHIDRTTGILTENFTYHLPNGSTQSDDPTTYRCTVGSARPTIPRFRR
jgi:hypothetical protein